MRIPIRYKNGNTGYNWESGEQFDEFYKFYNNNPVVAAGAKQVIENLSRAGIPLFTMSSQKPERWDPVATQINELFDNRIIPRFANGDKVSPLIQLIKEFNLNPRQGLFIDDSIKYVRGAKKHTKLKVARMMLGGQGKSPENLRVPHFYNFTQIENFVLESC